MLTFTAGKHISKKKANFLQICIFKGIYKLYREAVSIANAKKGPGLVYFIYAVDLSTHRNIEQTPS